LGADKEGEIVIVSPDAGGMKRAESFHKHFLSVWHNKDKVGLAMMHKERKEANKIEKIELLGTNV
jgi:phosphoribosylpyrophosphate synthetase